MLGQVEFLAAVLVVVAQMVASEIMEFRLHCPIVAAAVVLVADCPHQTSLKMVVLVVATHPEA
jgi:hypothetical protein